MNILGGSEGTISWHSQWITKQGWECSASHESWPANWGGGPLWLQQRTTWSPKKNKTKCKFTKVNSKPRHLSTFFDHWGLIGSMPTDLEEVNREPLTPPKVERATEMGMIHDMTPSSFSPNVWERRESTKNRREFRGQIPLWPLHV